MANLDDFFAKKDKKKKKGFSKANTDVLAKNLEENERREQKADEKAASLATSEATKLALEDAQGGPSASAKGQGGGNNKGSASNGGGKATNDEEWRDYESEKKDYSGLKISSLKVSEKDDDDDEHEINDDGEKVRVKKGDSGPWNKNKANKNKANKSPETKDASSEDSDDEDKDDEDDTDGAKDAPPTAASVAAAAAAGSPAAAQKSSYVPPHLRGRPAGGPPSRDSPASGGPSLQPTRLGGGPRGMRNRAAPDINSEVYFPSLSATGTGEDPGPGGRDDFKEVRSGGGQQMRGGGGADAPRLALGNKFAALRG